MNMSFHISSNIYIWAEKNAKNKALLTGAPDKDYLSFSASTFIK